MPGARRRIQRHELKKRRERARARPRGSAIYHPLRFPPAYVKLTRADIVFHHPGCRKHQKYRARGTARACARSFIRRRCSIKSDTQIRRGTGRGGGTGEASAAVLDIRVRGDNARERRRCPIMRLHEEIPTSVAHLRRKSRSRRKGRA